MPGLIGVDEAGRGPLAGPVLAAAVLLPAGNLPELAGVSDSKTLSAARREALFREIRQRAVAVSASWAHPEEIARLNILGATLAAMRRAVARIPEERALVVVDGPHMIPRLGRPQQALVGGDRKSMAVACASIVAKVLRDRWMARLDRLHPGYGLARHKGYGTPEHLRALRELGPSPRHRRTFAPVRELLASLDRKEGVAFPSPPAAKL